jgi:hypothetical protein
MTIKWAVMMPLPCPVRNLFNFIIGRFFLISLSRGLVLLMLFSFSSLIESIDVKPDQGINLC